MTFDIIAKLFINKWMIVIHTLQRSKWSKTICHSIADSLAHNDFLLNLIALLFHFIYILFNTI